MVKTTKSKSKYGI